MLYFDEHFHRPLREYSRIFDAAGAKRAGEISPSYATLPASRIRFIRALMPDARIVFLMRNPVERAWSDAKMELLTLQGRPPDAVTEADYLAELRSARSIGRGDYAAILDRWFSVFPREQVYVGVFEEMVSRPREVLAGIFRHIGVRADVDWGLFPTDKVVFKGPEVPMPAACRRELERRHPPEAAAALGRSLGLDLLRSWRSP